MLFRERWRRWKVGVHTMYGDIAIELLRELKRSPPHLIPPYNEDRVRLVVDEMNALYEEVQKTISQHKGDSVVMGSPAVKGSMWIQYQAILRNKRCLLAYSTDRTKRLEELRWDVGAVLPMHVRANLSQHEVEYFSNYSKGLNTYMQEIGLDLASDLAPPKELYIEVRVLEDVGEIATEEGSVNLEKDTQHFLRRSDVEPLIRQGMLEHIV